MKWPFGSQSHRVAERADPSIGSASDLAAIANLGGDSSGDVDSASVRRLTELFGVMPTSAGAVVNEQTSLQVSAVYGAVRLLAGAVATLPLPIYERQTDWRKQVDHDLWWLLNEQPCPRFTAAAFWENRMSSVLLRGDAISYIARGANNSVAVKAIVPIKRQDVLIYQVGDRLRYAITDEINGVRGYFTADQDDVLHFPNFGFDGISSPSTISTGARQAIGIAIKADEHAGQFFGSGAHVQFAVKVPGKMSPKLQEEFKEAWVEKYSGAGVSKVPLILTEGLALEQLSMSAADAQLMESRKFQVVEIARAFGLPPHMIGETTASTSWGSGIEQMGIGFVAYALRPHLRRIEQELNRKLWPRSSRYFVEFDLDHLLAGDRKTQADVESKSLGGPGSQGWRVPNEIRKAHNLPPIEGGDKLIIAGGKPPTQEPSNEPTPEDPPASA